MTENLDKVKEKYELALHKRIDELLAQKRFGDAASLAVALAYLNIDPEELVQLLLDEIKKIKEEKHEPHKN